MTGVEAAGLALGAIPLLLSALDHCRQTADVLKTWWKVKVDYRKCMHDLTYYTDELKSHLEELLLPMIADDKKLKQLLDEPGGAAWSDPELEAALQRRMPSRYESYVNTIHLICDLMEKLDKALGTNNLEFQTYVSEDPTSSANGMPRRTLARLAPITLSSNNLRAQPQRLRHALNRSVREELFKRFGEYNSRLGNILGASDRVSGLIEAQPAETNALERSLSKIWYHGNEIYRLLVKAFPCQCEPPHQANMLLQHASLPTVTFQMIFGYKAQLSTRQVPWTWQLTSISLMDESMNAPGTRDPASPAEPLPNVNQKDNPKSRLGTLSKYFKSKIPRPSTKIKSAPAIESIDPTGSNARNLSERAQVAFSRGEINDGLANPSHEEITNLCEKICSCSADLRPYGILSEESNRYIIQPLNKSHNDPLKQVTLEGLLSTKSKRPLNRTERFKIAYILASSYLQFSSTPWLRTKWSKRDVIFFYDHENEDGICIDHPYVSKTLLGRPSNVKELSGINTTSTIAFRNGIRSLAVILLELCFGQCIEDTADWKHLFGNLKRCDEQLKERLCYSVADNWSGRVLGEAGPEYMGAVNWCLHHVFYGGADEKDGAWREDMLRRVVGPLRVCHGYLCGTAQVGF